MTLPFIEALLPMPAQAVLPVLQHRALDIGFEVTPEGEGLRVLLSGGDLLAVADAESTRLRVTAQDMPHLQMLRDYLTEEISAAGMVPHWQGHRSQGHPDNHALAHVVSADQISPSYIRVTVAAQALSRFATGGLHFRLLFGPPNAAWPVLDANGVTEWPQGAAAWHKPVYTIRHLWDLGGMTHLSFDVFVHDGGRVTDWCRGLVPGTEIVLSGPGGGKGLAHEGWCGLIGDETAVPVIARLLADMPAGAQGQAVLVVPGAADVQMLDHPPGVQVTWATRDTGATPLGALDLLRWPDDVAQIFFAAEATEARIARKILAERGLQKARISAAAYWTKT